MGNKYWARMKQRITVLEEENKSLRAMAFNKRYQISQNGDPECGHELSSWELSSESGIAFCDWKCSKCQLIVSQTLGERIPPTNIPKEKNSWEEE